MDELCNDINFMYIYENKVENYSTYLAEYINSQTIDDDIKSLIIDLINNDNYNDYIDIYNICLENDIELPPLL